MVLNFNAEHQWQPVESKQEILEEECIPEVTFGTSRVVGVQYTKKAKISTLTEVSAFSPKKKLHYEPAN